MKTIKLKHLALAVSFLIITAMFAQNNALNFDGTNDAIIVFGGDVDLNISGTALTIEAWIYPTGSLGSGSSEKTVVTKEDDDSNQSGYFLRHGGGKFNFGFGTGTDTYPNIVSDANIITLNQWHHIAGTYDGANLRLYHNGVEVKSISETATIGASIKELHMGRWSMQFDRYFQGDIDEVRIWNVVRTDAEIASSYNTGIAANSPGLVANYKFNQGTAGGNNAGETTLLDATGNHNGTLQNFGLSGSTSNFIESTIPQVFGSGESNALNFDGTNDYVSVPDNNELDLTQNFTIEAWVYPTNNSDLPQYILIKGNPDNGGSSGYNFLLVNDGGPKFRFQINTVGNGTWWDTPIAFNTWTHVAATYDGTTIKFYKNGAFEHSFNPASGGDVNTSNEPLTLGGAATGDNQFHGNLDEVRIWNVVRTDAEIASSYNKAIDPDEPGLVAYYRFNQGTAEGDNTSISTLLDATGNHDGHLNNFVLTGNASNFVGSADLRFTVVWSGSESNDWSAPGNWVGNAVPGPNDNVLVPDGTPHDPVVGAGLTGANAARCFDMEVQTGANLTVNGELLMTGGGN